MNPYQYKTFLVEECLSRADAAHDLAHVERVVKTATDLAQSEHADPEVVLAAAWLHDCVVLPKDHPDRKKASSMAAQKAVKFLSGTPFPKLKLDSVAHAIRAHSYSAQIRPETLEAKIVQDADRLDALGAIGIARCFLTGGKLNRPLYHTEDPFCSERSPDDSAWTIDHFYKKLFKLSDTLHTESAKKEGLKRVAYMKNYLDQLRREL